MICGLLLITTGRNRAKIYLANKQKGVNTEQVLRLAFIWSQDIVALWNRYVFGFREAPQSKNDKKGDIVPFRWPSPPYIWCLKKRANCDKCVFATKQRMFGVLAIIQILYYRGLPIPHIKPPCLHVCRQIWRFVVNLPVCIVYFQVIWGPGKFRLKWMNWGRPPPPRSYIDRSF